MKNIKQLTDELDFAINEYIEMFCKKHDIEFDYWVADRTGTVCQMGDHFFNFEDIRYDLETDQPSNQIFDWYDVTLELAMEDKQLCNYQTWCKGWRPNTNE